MFNKKQNKARKKIINTTAFSGAVFIGILPFIFVVYLLLTPIIQVVKKDYSSKKMRIISETLKIRSEKESKSYIIGVYDYGTEVTVHEIFKNSWAEVSVGDVKGYMSLEFLVSPEQFYLIDGMYGNDNAKKYIKKTKYRKAIASYLQKAGYITNISKKTQEKLYNNDKKREVWQLFAENNNLKYNTFCYGDFNGDNINDAAYIIKNINTGERKLIILDLKSYIPGEYSNLLHSETLDNSWDYIRTASKGQKYIINSEEVKIKIAGIIKGSNREESFNDIDILLLYDGEKVNPHLQKNISE